MAEETKYSVYVNDSRVNDNLLTEVEAENLVMKYIVAGVKDAYVVDETEETNE